MSASPAPILDCAQVVELRARLFGFVEASAVEEDLPSFTAALNEYVVGELELVKAELARLRSGEQVTEWGVRQSGGPVTAHPSRDDAADNLRGLKARGQKAELVVRTLTYSRWEVAR
jgi:hypothetical protein